jgi:hypothetical protein
MRADHITWCITRRAVLNPTILRKAFMSTKKPHRLTLKGLGLRSVGIFSTPDLNRSGGVIHAEHVTTIHQVAGILYMI